MTPPIAKPVTPVARFTLILEYDEYPDTDTIDEILVLACGDARVTSAILERLQLTTRVFA